MNPLFQQDGILLSRDDKLVAKDIRPEAYTEQEFFEPFHLAQPPMTRFSGEWNSCQQSGLWEKEAHFSAVVVVEGTE